MVTKRELTEERAARTFNEAIAAGVSEDAAAREADAVAGALQGPCEACRHCSAYFARDVVGRRFYECHVGEVAVATDAEDTCEYFERREHALGER